MLARWSDVNPDPRQLAFFNSTSMLNCCYAGRRSLKTEAAKRRLVMRAMSPSPYTDRRYFACAPTHDQAKHIFWDDIQALVPDWALATGNRDRDISHSDLSIRLHGNVLVRVAGLDKPSRIEGGFWAGGICDEYDDCKSDVLTAHIMPMLVRPGSYVDIIGVPNGMGNLHQLVQQIEGGEIEDAQTFHWKASEVLWRYLGRERAESFLAQAKATMDPDTYDQEWNASFVSTRNLAYYGFDASIHAVEPLAYNPRETLYVSFDWNVDPSVCICIQERLYRGDNPKVDTTKPISMVVDEIVIPNANTPRLVRELLSRYGQHEGDVRVYADASGGSRHSSQTEGSDIDLLRKYLTPVFGSRIVQVGSQSITYPSRMVFDIPSSNPPVRSRINAVNSRLMSADGVVHMLVDPRCKVLIRDLEGCTLKPNGNLDKGDLTLSHTSDATGYCIAKRFPLVEHVWIHKTM